eukprot:5501289-Prymnesium_polylepis.2
MIAPIVVPSDCRPECRPECRPDCRPDLPSDCPREDRLGTGPRADGGGGDAPQDDAHRRQPRPGGAELRQPRGRAAPGARAGGGGQRVQYGGRQDDARP